jgi:hypothetical protein
MQVHASREHELAPRIDLARSQTHVADRADTLTSDRDIRATLTVRGDDEPALYG